MTNLHYFGIIPGEPEYKNNQAYCGVIKNITSIYECTEKYLDGNSIQRDFEESCAGK